MNKEFYQGNREKLYAQMKENALLVLFSGTEVRKTNDEFYPFYTNRNFLYLTGLDQKELALIARRRGPGDGEGLYPAAGLAGRALERRAHQGGGSRGALRHRGRRLHGQL